MQDVVIVGCGAVGLPLAVAMAVSGYAVVGVDTNAATIGRLSAGEPQHLDLGLETALQAAMRQGRLSFLETLPAQQGQATWILAVATPIGDDGAPHMDFFESAVTALDRVMSDGDNLIVRATVPIGTTRRLAERLSRQGRRLRIAACPDRSVAGLAFRDQTTIPNIVGAVAPDDTTVIAKLLQPLGPVEVVSSPETAEALKLFANVYRDVRFAMANEMALICEAVGIDFSEIATTGAVGYGRFEPGRPGPVGGPCLTKDVVLLSSSLDIARPALGLAGRAVNAGLLDWAEATVRAAVDPLPKDASIAILGLAFKGVPETRDRRNAFGIDLSLRLSGGDRVVRTWDPGVDPVDGLANVVAGAGVVVFANDHPALGGLDLVETQALMHPRGLILDVAGCRRSDDRAASPPIRLHTFGEGRARSSTGFQCV